MSVHVRREAWVPVLTWHLALRQALSLLLCGVLQLCWPLGIFLCPPPILPQDSRHMSLSLALTWLLEIQTQVVMLAQ